jgi:hypothetical protein
VDSAIAYALEETDIVLVGAEAVVETGGFINRVQHEKSLFDILDWHIHNRAVRKDAQEALLCSGREL